MHNILAIFFVIIAVAIVSVGTALTFYIEPTVVSPVVSPRFEYRGRFSPGMGDELMFWVDTKTGREYITTTRGGIIEIEIESK